MFVLMVNGQTHRLDVDGETPLLWVLREHLGLMGTKYCCGIAECGACTVHVDGEAVLSCVTPIEDVIGKEIITIEGLEGPVADRLLAAWLSEEVSQCGYCQPAQIMTAAALLAANPNPGDEEIDRAMSGVLCRCGTYQEIRRAIRKAVQS